MGWDATIVLGSSHCDYWLGQMMAVVEPLRLTKNIFLYHQVLSVCQSFML